MFFRTEFKREKNWGEFYRIEFKKIFEVSFFRKIKRVFLGSPQDPMTLTILLLALISINPATRPHHPLKKVYFPAFLSDWWPTKLTVGPKMEDNLKFFKRNGRTLENDLNCTGLWKTTSILQDSRRRHNSWPSGLKYIQLNLRRARFGNAWSLGGVVFHFCKNSVRLSILEKWCRLPVLIFFRWSSVSKKIRSSYLLKTWGRLPFWFFWGCLPFFKKKLGCQKVEVVFLLMRPIIVYTQIFMTQELSLL